MTTAEVWLVIGVAGFGTFLTRASFLLVADRTTRVPPMVSRLLRMIPPAALSSLVALSLARPSPDATTPARALAALATALVVWWRGNLVLALVVGMVVVVALDPFF